MEIVEALSQINNSIGSLSRRNDLTAYFPIIAVLISTATAIAATWASVRFSSRRLELNCVRALVAEIEGIDAQIRLALCEERQKTYVRISFLSAPERMCPIYKGAATNIGLIKSEAITDLIKFYSAVLTIKPIKVNDQELGDAFSKEALEAILATAKKSVLTFRHKYGNQIL